jgi:hypothetical protein
VLPVEWMRMCGVNVFSRSRGAGETEQPLMWALHTASEFWPKARTQTCYMQPALAGPCGCCCKNSTYC